MKKIIPTVLFILTVFIFAPSVQAQQIVDISLAADPKDLDDITVPFQMRLNFPILKIHTFFDGVSKERVNDYLGIFAHAGARFLNNSASVATGISYSSTTNDSRSFVAGIGVGDSMSFESRMFFRVYGEGFTRASKCKFIIDVAPEPLDYSEKFDLSVRAYRNIWFGLNSSIAFDEFIFNIGPRFEIKVMDQHFIWFSPLYELTDKVNKHQYFALAAGATLVF